MKTLSIFTAKGGCGKTTNTILMAACLAYKHKKKVLVIDFEAPSFRIRQFRDRDIKESTTPGTPLFNYLVNHPQDHTSFEIQCHGKEINQYSTNDIVKLVNMINGIIAKDEYDYLLFDFPAGLSKDTLVSYLAVNHLIDLVCIPSSTEAQERYEAYRTGVALKNVGQDVRLFWNRIQSGYVKAPELLQPAEEGMKQAGLKYLKSKIKNFSKATQTADTRCFVRNTLCWPERYIEMACPELISLLEEIKEILDAKE